MAEQVSTQLQDPALRNAELAARVARAGQPAASRPAAEAEAPAAPAAVKQQAAQDAQQAAATAAQVAFREEEGETPASALLETEEGREQVKDAFGGLNDMMGRFNKSIRFAVFDDSGDLYAQIVNTETEEVVKTIPSEAVLRMMARVDEVLGLLVDEQM